MAERREAWEASKTIGAAVADDVRELARLRNEAARSLGYRDWFALAVATSEMDESAALRHARRVRRAHRRAVRGSGRRRPTRASPSASAAASPSSRPGTTRTRSSRRCPPRAESTSRTCSTTPTSSRSRARPSTGSGSRPAAILERSDLYPRDGKCQHAFCIDIDREGDVRVLANVAPDRYWADTMLHELGHGAFDLGIDRSLPWLLRGCHLTAHRGHRDPHGPPRAGRRLAPRRRGRRRRRGGRARRRASTRPARPRCSSSRAGCS